MKQFHFFLIACCLLLQNQLFAQDKILYLDGKEEWVKILEVARDSVRFLDPALTDQVKPRVVAANTIFSVTFQNGKITLIAEPIQEQTYYSEEVLYRQGRADARSLYKAGNVFWTTFGVTLGTSVLQPGLGTLAAMGTGTIIGLSKVPDKKVIASNPEFKQSPGYLRGYQQQAKNKRLGNAAAGFGTAVGVLGVAVAVLINSIY